jgi:hypothetical protein
MPLISVIPSSDISPRCVVVMLTTIAPVLLPPTLAHGK